MKFLHDRQFYYSLLIAVFTGIAFIIYMLTIGIPKTASANYYHLAKQQEGLGDLGLAKKYLELSINAYPEEPVLEDYERLAK